MTKMLDVLESFLNYHGYIYLRLDGTTRVEQRQVMCAGKHAFSQKLKSGHPGGMFLHKMLNIDLSNLSCGYCLVETWWSSG